MKSISISMILLSIYISLLLKVTESKSCWVKVIRHEWVDNVDAHVVDPSKTYKVDPYIKIWGRPWSSSALVFKCSTNVDYNDQTPYWNHECYFGDYYYVYFYLYDHDPAHNDADDFIAHAYVDTTNWSCSPSPYYSGPYAVYMGAGNLWYDYKCSC
eukprot:243192_1